MFSSFQAQEKLIKAALGIVIFVLFTSLVLLGAGFILAWIYLSLAETNGWRAASLLLGLGLLIVTSAIAAIAYVAVRRKRQKKRSQVLGPETLEHLGVIGAAAAARALAESFGRRSTVPMLGLIAGVALASSPGLRKTLSDALNGLLSMAETDD